MIRTEEIMRRINDFIEEMEKLGVKVKVTVTFDVKRLYECDLYEIEGTDTARGFISLIFRVGRK